MGIRFSAVIFFVCFNDNKYYIGFNAHIRSLITCEKHSFLQILRPINLENSNVYAR